MNDAKSRSNDINYVVYTRLLEYANEVFANDIEVVLEGTYTAAQMAANEWPNNKSCQLWKFKNDNVEHDKINIEYDTFKCSITKHGVFIFLYQFEKMNRIKDSYKATFTYVKQQKLKETIKFTVEKEHQELVKHTDKKELHQAFFHGVCLDIENGMAVATQSNTLAYKKIKVSGSKQKITIHADVWKKLSGECTIEIPESMNKAEYVIRCKDKSYKGVIETAYPKYEDAIPNYKQSSMIQIDCKQLKEACKKLVSLTDKDTAMIGWYVLSGEKEMHLSCKDMAFSTGNSTTIALDKPAKMNTCGAWGYKRIMLLHDGIANMYSSWCWCLFQGSTNCLIAGMDAEYKDIMPEELTGIGFFTDMYDSKEVKGFMPNMDADKKKAAPGKKKPAKSMKHEQPKDPINEPETAEQVEPAKEPESTQEPEPTQEPEQTQEPAAHSGLFIKTLPEFIMWTTNQDEALQMMVVHQSMFKKVADQLSEHDSPLYYAKGNAVCLEYNIYMPATQKTVNLIFAESEQLHDCCLVKILGKSGSLDKVDVVNWNKGISTTKLLKQVNRI